MSEEEYIVESIEAWRYLQDRGTKEYLIKWKNYDESDNTWEPVENLSCNFLLKEFEESLDEEDAECYHKAETGKLNGLQRHAPIVHCFGPDKEDHELGEPVVNVMFADSPFAEEVTLEDLFRYQLDEAFKFCEERLISKDLL